MKPECDKCRSFLSDYLDGELAPAHKGALEAHLDACDECRLELDAWRRTVRAVGALPRHAAPAGFARRVRDRLARAPADRERSAILVLWSRALPVAALFALVVGLTFAVRPNGLFHPTAAPERLAMSLERGPQPLADRVTGAPLPATRVAGPALGVAPSAVSEAPAGLATAGGEAARELLAAAPSPQEEAGQVAGAERPEGGAEVGLGVPPAAAKAEALDQARQVVAEESAPQPEPYAATADMDARVAEAWAELDRMAGELAEQRAEARRAEDEAFARGVAAGSAAMKAAPVVGNALGRMTFRQVPAAPPQPQQVLALWGADPAGLARQAVEIANARGLEATLDLREGGGVDVFVQAPGSEYAGLLREMSGLAEPPAQSLSNTALAAKDAFFDDVLGDYNVRNEQAAGRETRRPPERETWRLQPRLAAEAMRQQPALVTGLAEQEAAPATDAARASMPEMQAERVTAPPPALVQLQIAVRPSHVIGSEPGLP